jgi:hypothetical protein
MTASGGHQTKEFRDKGMGNSEIPLSPFLCRLNQPALPLFW